MPRMLPILDSLVGATTEDAELAPSITRITYVDDPRVVGVEWTCRGTLLDGNGSPLAGYGESILVELWRGGLPAPDRSNVEFVGYCRTESDGSWAMNSLICKSWDVYYLTAKFAGNEQYAASQQGVRLKMALMPTVIAITDVVEPRQAGVSYPYQGTLTAQDGSPVSRSVIVSLFRGASTSPESVVKALADVGVWVANMTCLARDTYVLLVEFDGDGSSYAGAPAQSLNLPATVAAEPTPLPEPEPLPPEVEPEPLPRAPGSISATAEETSIYVDWYAVYEAESYVLYRNLTPDLASAIIVLSTVGDTRKYTDYDVLPGRTYYYWVASRNAAGDSDPTGPAVATLPEPEAPEPYPPIPEPEPDPDGFVPGDNIRRVMSIVNTRLEEIREKKAAGEWPPW